MTVPKALRAPLIATVMAVSACGGGRSDELQAGLSWDASVSERVTGYRVYSGTASGTYNQPPGTGVHVGARTNYTVSGLVRGQTYYFAVTAVDAAGNESTYSNEASMLAQ